MHIFIVTIFYLVLATIDKKDDFLAKKLEKLVKI
jgi:hypothetical protein